MKLRKNTPVENEGINYVKTIFEKEGCLFHELQLKNDYGIDVIIEIPVNKELMGNLIALQIKSGASFCTKDSCTIPADRNHFEYWYNYSLPVLGIVYDPCEKIAYWEDIKTFLRLKPSVIERGPYRITFSKNTLNMLNKKYFKHFIFHIQRNLITLNFDLSLMYVKSSEPEKYWKGMSSLLRDHLQNIKTWDFLFDVFHSSQIGKIDPSIIYAFSHITHNPDIFYSERTVIVGSPLEKILKERLSKFTKNDVIKLLSVIDENDTFQRGDLSQCVYMTLTEISNIREILNQIFVDNTLSKQIRVGSLCFFSDGVTTESLPFLEKIIERKDELNETAMLIRDNVVEWGHFSLY